MKSLSPAVRTRVRPADRKRQIAEAAARAFSVEGYHGASMSEIARAVGISAPALYRHFPHKYALFVSVCTGLTDRLLEAAEASDGADPSSPAEAEERLDRLFAAVTEVTLETRDYSGIYRWEGRHLETADRKNLTAAFAELRSRVARLLTVARPDLAHAEVDRRALAALSAIASATAHRTTPPRRRLESLLHGAASRVALGARSPALTGCPQSPPTLDPPLRRRERLVVAATTLFAARGYAEVTVEDIARAVDLTPSGVYRHFDGKAALLEAAFAKAASALRTATAEATADATAPAEALNAMCGAYVRHSLSHSTLMRVYFAEAMNLPPAAQRRIHALQRDHVAAWVQLVLAQTPALDVKDATVLVHAAFGIVTDQISARASDEGAVSHLSTLMQAVLQP